MNPLQPSKHNGFTIVELVVVIAALGILTSVALSRFVDVDEQAQLVVVEQTAASFQQGVLQARIKWQLQGRPQGTSANQGPRVDLGGTLVRVDPNLGYPVGNGGQDSVDTMSLQDCITAFDDILQHSFSLERRNQVDNITFKNFDFIITRQNNNPDICNYYWSASTENRPPNGAPSIGTGFRYFTGTGATEVFDF
jgi:prepilin-type N-terminal cleavage/methylation domain-containing protein